MVTKTGKKKLDQYLFRSVDEYIKNSPEEARNLLVKIRSLIREVAPDAKERTDYFNFPGYSYEGYDYNGMFVWFSYKKPFVRLHLRPPVLDNHKKELSTFPTTRAIVSFSLHKNLPEGLIKELVKESLGVMKTKDSE